MSALKLLALDAEDLEVVSAQVQDAVLKVGDIHWRADEKRLVLALNRFAWEGANGRRGFERRRAALHLARVVSVKAQHLSPDRPNVVLELLALRFTETDAPSGVIDLVFAGGATLRVEVECLEVGLADLGAAWATDHCPQHDGA
ncbi:MAG: DUF2948 family protein [Hyphomicrobiales bacterium]|nr:DUF2948 family protein [Hyphomicrobiales bacterium]